VNGVHDMGGMHGMGSIRREEHEPVFHEPWEGRVYAMTRLVRARGGRQNIDNARHLLELLPPADYLRMSYYERWYARLAKQIQTDAIIGHDKSPITSAMVPALIARRSSARRDVPVAPRFHVGDCVRARNINPVAHTRLPRYARGKIGIVVRDHGVFVFPDTNAEFAGEKPQHVYSVRFAARELWGDQASPRDCVHIDMWDDYLERA
jgi:nitrile hydratase subunit beta